MLGGNQISHPVGDVVSGTLVYATETGVMPGLKVVLEANLEVFSAFPLLSKLVKYYSKLCKIFLNMVELCVDYKNIVRFFIKCKEFMEFEEF